MSVAKKLSRAAAACAAILLSGAPACAAPAPAPSFSSSLFSSIGTRDGLPNASVSGIAQDSQGFLWFGTQGGLARYDGYSFKLFAHVPFDRTSLPHDLVQTIYLDGEAVWAGTYGGLGRLELRTERFSTFANDPARADSLSNDVVTSITRDARGSLWVGTLSGLNLLDEATGRFERFRHDAAVPGSLPSDVVRSVFSDRLGRLWIGTSGGGLARFDYASRSFRAYRKDASASGSILSDFVMAIDQDSSDRLWIATWYGGLSLFDPASGRFENFPTADERAYSLCAAEDGKVYVGTWGGGLFEFDIASSSFARHRASASPGSLSNDVVYSMLRDGSGDLWIGTNGGGVCKLGLEGRSFEVLAASQDGMPQGKVYSALVDRLGYLWVGVYNEGVARRDPATGKWRRYRREAGDPRSLPNDIVNFLREDAKGELWAGTNDGLARYDRASDSFSVARPVPGRRDSLGSEVIYAMADDPRGGAWIGTFRSGLEHWADGNALSSGFSHYSHDGADPASLSDNLVTALAYDGSGRLWVGTNRGLNRLEGEGPLGKPSFVRYLYDPDKAGGVSSDSIRTIFLDSRGVLWIGTAGGGLMRYEPETDSFVNYTRRDGLPSNTVLRVLEDPAAGNLWVSTQSGIAVYDRANGRFRGLSVYSELRSAEFFSGAFRAGDGSLYFGALDRLYRFDPGRYVFNDHRPPVVLSSVAAKRRAPIGAAEAARIGRLDLSWRENSVSFEFAALDYRDPERNRYSYRLEGVDAEWSPVGAGHSATYTNLPGGRYAFRVRGSNNDGLWNMEGVSLPIKVGYTPWTSPFAMVLYVIFFASAGYVLAFLASRAALGSARAEADSLLARLAEMSVSMETVANVDPLTGLPNKRKLIDSLDKAFDKAVRTKLELAVVMVDIDHFKAYNDRNGRAAGDRCLRDVSEAISGSVRRSSDLAGRYGEEEFLLILEETGLDGALAKGEGVRRAVEELGIPSGSGHSSGGSLDGDSRSVVTVSVGCAAVQPDAAHSPAFLVDAAEKALMAAKQRGRNRTSD